MHHHHTFGRSGTLQATALRCVMQDTVSSTSSAFAPGVLQRSVTTLTQDDLQHRQPLRREPQSRRPESLVEVKRRSDPSQEASRSFLNVFMGGPGEGFFSRLGSGRASHAVATTPSKASIATAAAAVARKKEAAGRRGYEKKAAATFYALTDERDEGMALSWPRGAKSKMGTLSDARQSDTTGKGVPSRQRSFSMGKSVDDTKVAAGATTEASKAGKVPKGGAMAPDSRVVAKNSGSTKGAAKTPKDTRKKSTRRRFFKGRTHCTGHAEEETTEEEVDGGVGAEKKWTRSSSLRRPFGGGQSGSRLSSSGDTPHSDTELGKISAPHSLLDGECGSVGAGSITSERAIDVGRVGAWATSFEKLLEDPAGLHTFAEFLKKEYSHENIYFWTACERYKRLTYPEELRATAREIFERHLYSSAPEPVNVDSQARQDAQDGLHHPSESLFAQAQKQIFNLMKFDSYSRFLKSTLFQDCLTREVRGQPLPYPGDETLDPDLRIATEDSHVKLKKSRSDAEERRRKSLLPWSRKDRSKSKDRGEAEYRRRKKQQQHGRNASDSSSLRSDVSGSRTSLNSSSDLPLGRRAASRESLTSCDQGSLSGGEGSNRCRVILPDLSNSVVALRSGETIQDTMSRLLERRGLAYSTFDVYLHKSDKILNKKEESVVLGGVEVRLEQRVLFQLALPLHKSMCVKAKPSKPVGEVLKPILLKYGYKLDLLHVHKEGEDKVVNLKAPITDIDTVRLVVQTKEEVKEWGLEGGRHRARRAAATTTTTSTTTSTTTTTTATTSTTTTTTTLDEITNRVFEDLRNGKFEPQFDDMGVMDLDAHSCRTDSSDRSSGFLGGFNRRNSFGPEKDRHSSKGRSSKPRTSLHDNFSLLAGHTPDHIHMGKRRGNPSAAPSPAINNNNNNNNNIIVQTKQENDELYEGLKRAQRSRLDDQRGTEINFELPDFLKCDQPQDKGSPHSLTDQLLARLECTFPEGVVGGASPGDYFSLAHPEVWGGLPSPPLPHHAASPASANTTLVPADLADHLDPDLDLDDFEDTLRGGAGVEAPPTPPLGLEGGAVPPRMPLTALPLSPPPLPPKPKVGGVRGPPPRPPSRQLHLLNPPPPAFPPPPPSSSNSDEEEGLCHPDQPPPLPPLHLGRQTHDKFNISFV